MLGNRSTGEWVEQYSQSHQHRVNKVCHLLGIPMITVSLIIFPLVAVLGVYWWIPTALFVGGWILQFVGHWFEGKPPEFFKDWRFLLIGLRWWFTKVFTRNARR
jgi:uncharacterized membrane protein YGL010W